MVSISSQHPLCRRRSNESTLRAVGAGAFAFGATLVAGEPRVWTSSDGKTVSAELVGATETTVTIKAEGGREYTLAHERLSAADQEFIAEYLKAKKAEYDSIVWPPATAEEAIKAAYFKRLHGIDPKRFNATYGGKILLIQGQVLEVREDKMSSNQGIFIVMETEDKVPIEFRFSKPSYEKDLTVLLGSNYNRYRGPYDEDEFRVRVVDKSLVVERRYVTGRDGYYNVGGNWRYRNNWSEWKAASRPLARGDVVKIRGEFATVFNSVMSFKEAVLIDPGANSARPMVD